MSQQSGAFLTGANAININTTTANTSATIKSTDPRNSPTPTTSTAGAASKETKDGLSERALKAETKLLDNPYDVDSWSILIKEYQTKKLDDARPFYERLVTRFPLTGRYWKLYIEHEMKSRNYDKVEKLFQRCLIKVLHIELWRCYLNYVKETKGALPSFREKMAQAYDFALEKIGIDIYSYQIWNDYVNFLKNVEAVGSYAENQKITAVRRVYQRGVVNPMHNIDLFWRDYITYEQGINQIIAEKMINDRSRDYMNARRVSKEYEAVTRGLNRNAPSLPPSTRTEEMKQVEIWRKYIGWEKNNPLRTEDDNLVIKRVVFAYEECLLCLAHYPDIWYEYAAYLEENSKIMAEKGDMNGFKNLQDEACAVYERATSCVLKTNLLIHFAYADFEEARNHKSKAAEIYNRLLVCQDEKFDPTLVYVQYMKFARRSESIKSARAVFKRAREDGRCSHQIFTCAALMEYYCSKDKTVACKIFELGLKKYVNNSSYILCYIDFLTHLNEENNARVLFERILTSSPLEPKDSLEIWNRFLQFESNIGDLSSIVKVEKRRTATIQKVYEKSQLSACLVDRYKFADLYPCSMQELRSIGYIGWKNSVPTVSTNEYHETNKTFMPDVSQMIPFKPVPTHALVPGSHSVAGGIFPPPPAIGQLLSILPHPSSFHGPFPMVDTLMDIIRNAKNIDCDPDKPSISFKSETSYLNGDPNYPEKINKRHLEDDFSIQDPSNQGGAPSFDIYRVRQLQKRVK